MTNPVIDVRSLHRRFGNKTALADVTLSVEAGCVLGLVGENGAGKTTLLRHLLGSLKPQQGQVSVFGKDPVNDPVGVLAQIGYLSEDRDLPDWMTVRELIRFTAAFYHSWDSAYADELQDTFELPSGQKVRSLSRGQRARAGLLLALAHRPNLLLLDEPSSGLDPVVRRDILGAIIRTVADEGRTVVFSSHLLDEVQRVCDHVAMIHQGRLVLTQPLDDVLASHHRLTIRFAQPLPTPPRLDAALTCEGAGRDWTVVCNGGREMLERELAAMSGEVLDDEAPSLDEIFVARATSPASHAKGN